MNQLTSDTQSGDDSGDQEVWNRREATLFHAWVQLRYHRRRQRFFDRLDKETKAITLLLSATLFGKYFVGLETDGIPWIPTILSSLTLLSLVFGYGDRKQVHKDLAESAGVLIAAIESVTPGDLTPEHTARWASEFAKLCSKAPPPLKNLTLICEREQAIALGKRPTAAKVGGPSRLIADYF